MVAPSTMGATSYINFGYLCSAASRYEEKQPEFHRRSPIAVLSAQWDDWFSRLHNQADHEKTNKAISHPQAQYCKDSYQCFGIVITFEFSRKNQMPKPEPSFR